MVFLVQWRRWAGFLLSSEIGLVAGSVVDGQIPFRPIEDVPDRVVIPFLGTKTTLRCFTCGGGIATASSDPCFVIGHPMANFELQHDVLAVGAMVFEGTVQYIGSLLIVVEHVMSAHGGDPIREAEA